MVKSISIPSIYSPKNINELISILKENRNFYFFSGGTYLMSFDDSYPDFTGKDIIYLGEIVELLRINHSERYTEFGASITLQKMINSGMQTLSKNTIQALEDISSSQIRSLSTIGGALCTYDKRFALSNILSTLQAQVEIKSINKKKIITKLINVSSLYDENGFYVYPETTFITKVRIPHIPTDKQLFYTIGSPLREEDSAVYFGLNYSISQNNLDRCHISVSCPKNCFFTDIDFDNTLSSITLPLSFDQLVKVLRLFSDKLSDTCKSMSDLQKERSIRLLHLSLKNISEEFISGDYS